MWCQSINREKKTNGRMIVTVEEAEKPQRCRLSFQPETSVRDHPAVNLKRHPWLTQRVESPSTVG